jgi:hypothetical protein
VNDEPGSVSADEPSWLASESSSGQGRREERERQLLVRRAIFTGLIVLIIAAALLGIRGCFDAREERGYENYASDLSSIAAENASISKQFFGRLADPSGMTPLEFEAEVKADRGAMEGLLDRAENLDPPGGLSNAHRQLEIAYGLRRDALSGFSMSAPAAIGDPSSDEAISSLAEEMRVLAAGDVLASRGAEELAAQLAAQEIDGPDEAELATAFLPDSPDWLAPDQLSAAIKQVAGNEPTDEPTREPEASP